ncbi:MAG: hypothetical protein OXC91_13820 [Rhodobacteraceae bacterium]|nr:hypothetical protein [Paracoccaceae bacterium]
MPNRHNRTGEREMSIAVMRFLAHQPFGEASHEEIREAIPYYTALTEDDMKPSTTRDGEELWEQIGRNIRSHKDSPNNFIFLGYLDSVPGGGLRITEEGRAYLESLDAGK